jgi:hypothetical protein
MIPAKADPEKQADYLKNEIEPRLAEAKAGNRAVYFVDAARFVLAPFIGFLWSLTRIFIQKPQQDDNASMCLAQSTPLPKNWSP